MEQYALYLRKSRADVEAEARGEGETLSKHRAALTEYARLAKGITQAQLAEAVGTTQGQIARWETGARNPKVPALAKLAQALGVTIEQLI